ncbi:carboxy-S-adenosyl-L-methionine synthase CmoA [Aliikangiella sp. G2MR2-5]|uniref:carboxy-S-adenosyl-L-methionine synthase CmoA n=1 Tax=Aliikangiella sp. G2MR2-5 TaxID=2788943 RepID=UPI0018AAF4B9|nr:carboxy-S-adenosyl-L-methionine synthase CmoA [Aliikangiella sp. G2MR2-5]
MAKKEDKIYSAPVEQQPFVFDANVAEVFPDMIERSVPGYQTILDNLSKFAERFVQPGTQCYDLGCSLGAASLAISSGIKTENTRIIGVDNSNAMLVRCKQHINAFKHRVPIELVESDILSQEISKASLIVLNFTLQFISRESRHQLIENIYNGMVVGGALVLSEKICFEDQQIDELMIDLHHQFKRENGYSDLEISQKRNALENVLLPEPLNKHIERLKSVGFKHVTCWLQEYNFISLLAVK